MDAARTKQKSEREYEQNVPRRSLRATFCAFCEKITRVSARF
jgi:hypothetical protein